MRVVGLDVSTTIAGISIVEDGELKYYSHYEFASEDDEIQSAFVFKHSVLPQLQTGDVFVLEDALKAYAGGRTSSTSIMKLVKFNGIVEFLIAEEYGYESIHKIHPATARKQAWGRSRPKDRTIDTKYWIVQQVIEKYKLDFPFKEKSKKTPKPYQDHVYDICDSITLSLSY